MELAGGRVLIDRGFRAVASNITPDPETGIGRWSEAA
jgi:mono/diheme cytochrome c family protein